MASKKCTNGEKQKRLVGLDLLRILMAVVVFMYHTAVFTNCSYRYPSLNCLASSGGVFMTGFFMLSGFSIGYAMQDKDLKNLNNIKTFWIKRLIGIMPLYLIIMIVYHVVWGGFSLKDILLIMPLDIIGLRAIIQYLPNMQYIWFVSNILFCYLLYPFVHNIVLQIRMKTKGVMLLFAVILLLYLQIVEMNFPVVASLYYSIFYRVLEFLVGVLAVSMKPMISKVLKKPLVAWAVAGVELSLLYRGIYHLVLFERERWCTIFVTPLFLVIIWTLAECNFKWLEKNKLLKYMSGCTFALYLGQVWTLRFFERNIPNIICGYRNIIKLAIIWGSTIVLTIVLHEVVEKPCKKLFIKKIHS